MNRNNHFKRNRGLLLGLLLVLLLSVSLLAGGAFAKYSKTITLQGTVKYTPIPSVAMAEISLSACEDADLIPGNTVSGSSAVTVTWKENALHAYLYVELTGDHASEITALGSDWTKLDVDGNVYVYHDGTPLTAAPDPNVPVEWSFTLSNEAIKQDQALQIKAYLIEQKEGATAKTTYENKGTSGAAISTASVEQVLRAVDVSCTVNDDYTVTNTGDIDVLIRATVVVNWVDEEGNPAPGMPAVTYSEGWTQSADGKYLFYNGVLKPNDSTTTPVIAGVEASPDDEYTLKTTVLAEAIQAEPATAAQEAWGATYSGGTWTVNP